MQTNEEQNVCFSEKISTGNGKMFVLKRKKNTKKKTKKTPSMRSLLTEKTPYKDILLPPISRLSRVNESQAIEFLPVLQFRENYPIVSHDIGQFFSSYAD